MADEYPIVLIPELPPDLGLAPVFRTSRGIAVRVSDEELAWLHDHHIPVVELFQSSNEYAASMALRTRDQALAAIESVQNDRLALLPPTDRGKFGVA